MREIEVSMLTDVIEKLCIEANEHLPSDVKEAIKRCRACEDGEIAKGVLDNIIENFDIADQENVPICQDTGMACVFLEIGQDVHFIGGDLTDAVNEGVRRGYDKGYLRKSVVKDPVRRGNTGDNTPAMIYTEIVPGEQVKITVGPKGFGSENMSAIRMFKPSAGLQGIKDFIIETVETAGPNPCPPMVVGVGIGGTFDKAALLAKKALMRPLDSSNPDPFYADLENEMLDKINELGIGPQGFGGRTTAIGVETLICPIMDARRNQVYTGVYRFEGDKFCTVKEQEPMAIEALAELLNDRGEAVVFLGDGVPVYREALKELLKVLYRFAPAHVNRQRAAAVAALGLLYAADGKFETATEHCPDYLRLSQAERERAEREAKAQKGEY